MKIVCVGGGPAGLYFALLMKKADPAHEVTVLERNRADDTFGFGVVFSDATLENFAQADPETHRAITESFFHWDDIDIHYEGQVLTSAGHGFAGMSRQALLDILRRRGEALGVAYRFQTEVDDVAAYEGADLVLAADGVNSAIRNRYAEHFQPVIDVRPNKFVWLGTTFPFSAFTFYFKEDEHGLWRVHAYRYNRTHSTFIVETTEEAWLRAGLSNASEDDTVRFCETLFERELDGHALLKNRSLWRSFPTVRNRRWYWKNVVLVGDAAHTAHFSIGSGTKLAMEDAISLAEAVKAHREVPAALATYDEERRLAVESTQRAAQVSLEWFENTERYHGRLPPEQFAFSLLTRSLRVTHENLRVRDPKFVETVDRAVAEQASAQARVPVRTQPPPPPMFTPFRLRDMVVPNRVVVSPMCQYSAEDGTPNDWHVVHLGSRAVGGAGLVIAEMTDVSREARISPGCAGLYKAEHVKAWARVVEFVHRHTPAKIGIQLAHAGRKGSTRRMWEGIDEPLPTGNWPIVSASPLPYFPHSQVPRAMTRADMDRVRDDFVRATAMADLAGFDLIEIHFAHGYLLASFVSPLTNRRTDEYGGSLGNRLRFPLEVFDAVRAAWPSAKPMSVRISAHDWAPDGATPDDAVYVAARLQAHGCDIVDVSTGNTVPDERPRYGRLFQTPFADRIRHEVGIPTMTVGAISTYADVNSILAAGRADLCVLARAHLHDPYWTRHAAIEQGYDLPWPDQYRAASTFTPEGRPMIDAVDLLRRYLMIDTTNPPGNEIAGARFLAEVLAGDGIESEIVEGAPGRANVRARVAGNGALGAIVLHHHIDVVYADLRYWTVDPFGGEISDGHLYGRGALDMKGIGIMQLAAMLAIKRARVPLKRDLVLLGTADEEAGSRYGARFIAEEHPHWLAGAEYALGEFGGIHNEAGWRAPLGMIDVSEKTGLPLRLTARSSPGHGSMPWPTTAPHRLVNACARLLAAERAPRVLPEVQELFRQLGAVLPASEGRGLDDLSRSLRDPAFRQRFLADRWYAAMVRTTFAVNMLKASEKRNVIPPEAVAEIDCRMLAGDDPDEVVRWVKAAIADEHVEVTALAPPKIPNISPPDTELYKALVTALHRRVPGVVVAPRILTGFTDNWTFRGAGLQAYGFSPILVGDEDGRRVHGNDERISLENIREGTRLYTEMLLEMAGA